MYLRLLASLLFAGLLFISPTALAADDGCCGDKTQAAQAAGKGCCGDKAQAGHAAHAADKADKPQVAQASHSCDMPCCKMADAKASADLLTHPFFLALDTEPPVPPLVVVRPATPTIR